MAGNDRYRPWAYADKKLVRDNQAQRFRESARALGLKSEEPPKPTTYGGTTAAALDQKHGGGGGLWGKFKDVAGDVAGAGMEALGAARKYTAAPFLGIAGGALANEVDPATGTRKGLSFGDKGFVGKYLGAVGEGLAHPQRAAEAGDQVIAGRYPEWAQPGIRAATDPLTFVGPGVAKNLIGGTSRYASVGRALLDQGGKKMVFGGVYGGYGGQKLAEKAGLGEGGQVAAALAGGLAGGLGAAAIGRGSLKGAGRAFKDSMAAEAPVAGMAGPWKTKAGQKAAAGFDLEKPPEGEHLFPHSAKFDPAEVKARVKHYIDNNYEESAPKNTAQRIETSRGPFYAGRKSPLQWEEETAAVLTPDEIQKAGNWYRELYGEFEKRYGPERATPMLNAYLAGQVNTSVEGGMTSVLRAHDKARGLKGDKVGGTSRSHEASLISEIKGEAPTAWKSDKIWDFMDSAKGKLTRTFMGDDPRGGQPFAGDVHQARDAGFIDPTVANFLQKETGKSLDELGLKLDFTGSAKPDDTQYQWLNKWGNTLAKDLNDKGWMGRNDWLASDIQAIGWMKFRKQLGLEGGTIDDAFKANTRRVSIEVAPGTGSKLDQVYGERYYALPPEKQQAVTEDLLDRVGNWLTEKTGNVVTRGASGKGYWEDYDPNYSYQWDVLASPEGAQDIVDLAAYATQQTEVLGHRFSKSGANGGVRFNIKGATPKQVDEFYKRMRAEAGLQGAAPTGDGLITLDMDGAWGKPGSAGYAKRRDAMIAASDTIAKDLGITVDAFDNPVEVVRSVNNWQEVPDGRNHLSRLVARGGNLESLAHQLSQEYEGWFDDALRSADGRPTIADGLPGGSANAFPDAAGFTGDKQSDAIDAVRASFGATTLARAGVNTALGAGYGALNPGEGQSRLEGAATGGGLALLRNFGLNPNLILNAAKAQEAAGQRLGVTAAAKAQAAKTARAQAGQAGVDLFDTRSRGGAIREASDYLASARGRIDQGLRQAIDKTPLGKLDRNVVKDTEVTPFVVKAKNAITNRIGAYEGFADHLFGRLDDSGLKVELDPQDGQWYVAGTKVAFGDMAERATPDGAALYQQLGPEQRAAVDDLQAFNDKLNQNLVYHGKGLPFDPEVRSSYFPRLVKGKNGEQKVFLGGAGGGNLSTTGSFMKERVMASIDEGVANKVDYAHPREAFRAMVRAKLKVAGDSYTAEALRPLGKTAKELEQIGGTAGFNYVQLPQGMAPQLNGQYFPRETAERIVAALTPRAEGTIEKGIRGVNTVLTPARAIADISWFLQQGAAMMFRHPVRGTAGALAVIKSSLGDPAAYRQLLDKSITDGAAKLGMARDEYLQLLISKGLQIAPDDLSGDVIAFKGLTGGTNIPGLKQVRQGYQAVGGFSNETFARYLNYARVELANDAVERAMKAGAMDDLEGAMSAVNRMTGFSGRTPSQIERLGEFAPKFFSAAVEQTFAAVTKGGLEGAIARRHMGRMLGIGAVLVTGINAARGYSTDFDPRSNNFLRVRNVGGLDVSVFGTYDTLFRAIAATAAGESGQAPHPDVKRLWHLAEGKMSPAVQSVYAPFIKQSTYNGEPLDPLGSWEGLGKAIYEQGKSSVPFGAQAFIEQGLEPAIEQRSLAPLKDAGIAELASGTGMTNSPVTPTENRNWSRDDVAKAKFGKGYNDLAGAEKAQVNEDPKVAKYQTEADRNTLTRADDRSAMTKLTLETGAQLDALSQELESGQISGNDFRDQLHSINDQLRGARKVLEQKSGGKLKGWFDLYDQATKPDGRLDYDKLDTLQAAYRAKDPTVDAELLKAIGSHDNATMRQYREAQKLAQDYYSIPAYKGMSLQDSEKAGRVLSAAQAAVTYGQAKSMRHALAMIAKQDPTAAKLARIAQNRGSNPRRKAFRKQNPLFAKFYSSALGVEAA